MKLKPNASPEFTQKLESEILPLLRKQMGFQDEITFLTPDRDKAFGISIWDTRENADTYGRETYPQIEKLLATVYEGTPHVATYEVSNSTFYNIAAKA